MPIKTEHWLPPHLQLIYDNTEGPFGSPDPFECWMLYALARDSNGRVLEIGSWRGRSACFIAQGLKDAHSPWFVTCVDWFDGDKTGGEGADAEQMKAALTRNNVRANIVENDMFAVNWSFHAKDVGLVFYDSDHGTEPTVRLLEMIHPHLLPHAKVVVHDADFSSSAQAIEHLTNKKLYRKAVRIEVWEGLVVLQKL